MFNLIRRISGSVHPRSDRPWNDDPTSNAPTLRKRGRFSSEPEAEDDKTEQLRRKKLKSTENDENSAEESSPIDREKSSELAIEAKEKEIPEVKEVTQGVKEVRLEEKPETAPENIRLPSEEAGELDDPATSPPPSEKGDAANEAALDEPADDAAVEKEEAQVAQDLPSTGATTHSDTNDGHTRSGTPTTDLDLKQPEHGSARTNEVVVS